MAGFGHAVPFEQTTPESFRAQIDTNFYGVVNLTRAALQTMRNQRSGHIINISSVGGRVGTPGFSAYQAAKWAVGGFYRSAGTGSRIFWSEGGRGGAWRHSHRMGTDRQG